MSDIIKDNFIINKKVDCDKLKSYLQMLFDNSHRLFLNKIVPNINADRILGIKMNVLQSIANKIYKIDVEDYLKNFNKFDYEEEIILYGLVLGKLKDKETFKKYLITYLLNNDSWLTNDLNSCHLRFIDRTMYPFLLSLMDNQELKTIKDKTYLIRYIILIMRKFYLSKDFYNSNFEFMKTYFNSDEKYILLAIAWYFENLFFADREEFYNQIKLIDSAQIVKLTKQKIKESKFFDKKEILDF